MDVSVWIPILFCAISGCAEVEVKRLILHCKLMLLVKVADSEYADAENSCGHDAQYRLHIHTVSGGSVSDGGD